MHHILFYRRLHKILFYLLAGCVIYVPGYAQHSLKYYIGQGLSNSPLLKDYQNQVRLNQLDSMRIRAGYQPQVNATSTNLFAPNIKGWGYDNAITNGGTFAELVQANKSLVSHKNLNAQFKNLDIANQSINNNSKITELDLKKSITVQYITTYSDAQWVAFNKELNTLLKKEEQALKNITENGVYKQTDYLTFLVTLQQQSLQLKQAQAQYAVDYATLNYLCGIVDTSSALLAEPVITPSTLTGITNSVFFKQYLFDSLKLTNNRSLIDLNYRPKGSLYADAGYNSSSFYNDYHFFGASVGFTINIVLYDGKQRRLQYDKLAIEEDTRRRYKEFATAQYNQQLAQLYQQLKATDNLLPEINNQVRYADALVKANNKLIETGEAHIADYVIALTNYINAKYLLMQNKVTRLQVINQINYWSR